jgi:phospholipid N-methyltransferase
MHYLTECVAFYREFRRQYRNTGSILPSSRALGRALVSEIRRQPGPRRILEVGPGTGAVTAEIVRLLRPDDRLDIVEINEQFIQVLRRRLAEEPLFQRQCERIRLMHAPLQEVAGEGVYDFMVSGLPLNNFPLSLVRDIFHAYRRLLKPEGVLSYFEYLAIREIKGMFVGRREKRRLHVLGRVFERTTRRYQIREDRVFLNVPPAVARHLRFG